MKAVGKNNCRFATGHRIRRICATGSKRCSDLVIATLAAIALLPLMMVIAAALYGLGMRHPVFTQRRVGQNGRIFTIYKFRTLSDRTCKSVPPTIARWRNMLCQGLRLSGLDELPQIANVIRGDMSLVGPRPHNLADHARFSAARPGYDARLTVKPGITGWAQICGWRGPITTGHQLSERLRHDVSYIAHANLLVDLAILSATVLLPFVAIISHHWHRRHAHMPTDSRTCQQGYRAP